MKTMQLINYEGNSDSFRLVEKEIPEIGDREVLIKIHLSPINPSDLAYIRGLYGIKKKLPSAPGFEGGGTVVKAGKESGFSEGDRVSCVAPTKGDGTWSEYMVVPPENCIRLIDSVSLDEGSMLYVNPMTAYAMFEEGRKKGHTAFVHTAAASALGKMIHNLGKKFEVPVIHIVRKSEQVDQLKNEGREFVLNSSDEKFQKELFKLSKKLNATYCLDAVGGEVASKIFATLPYGSELVSYGNLSEKQIDVEPGIFIFQNKKISGFWLSTFLPSLNQEEYKEITRKAQELLPECFRSEIHRSFTLENVPEAIEYYKKNMSLGKIVIRPSGTPDG